MLVTVGAQMPFDRLVRVVDAWAAANGRDDVIAQVGETDARFAAIRTTPFFAPQEFREHSRSASAIVAHAGMGTILTALELGKPLLVFPREAARRETRTDHQIATARRFAESGRLLAAFDEAGLRRGLDEVERFVPSAPIGSVASAGLVARLRQFASG